MQAGHINSIRIGAHWLEKAAHDSIPILYIITTQRVLFYSLKLTVLITFE